MADSQPNKIDATCGPEYWVRFAERCGFEVKLFTEDDREIMAVTWPEPPYDSQHSTAILSALDCHDQDLRAYLRTTGRVTAHR